MALPLYSQRFAASHAGAGGTIVVPAGLRYVIRFVTLFNADALAPAYGQLIHVDSSCTIVQRHLGPQAAELDSMRFVMDAGETLQIVNDPSVDVTVSGYALTAP